MSPVHDPRYSKARWKDARAVELEESERIARAEYVKPWLVLAPAVLIGVLMALGSRAGALPGLASYVVWLGVSLAVGFVGLLISVRLFLGDAGPMGLAVVRLAAALAAAHVVRELFALSIYTAGLSAVVFIGLVMWLFDMDALDAALLGFVILVLVILASVALIALLPAM